MRRCGYRVGCGSRRRCWLGCCSGLWRCWLLRRRRLFGHGRFCCRLGCWFRSGWLGCWFGRSGFSGRFCSDLGSRFSRRFRGCFSGHWLSGRLGGWFGGSSFSGRLGSRFCSRLGWSLGRRFSSRLGGSFNQRLGSRFSSGFCSRSFSRGLGCWFCSRLCCRSLRWSHFGASEFFDLLGQGIDLAVQRFQLSLARHAQSRNSTVEAFVESFFQLAPRIRNARLGGTRTGLGSFYFFTNRALGQLLGLLAVFNQCLEEFAAVTVDLRVHA